jgi:parallel beta-helix repeat protein
VKNCYDVNANHDDGFQSWSVGPGGVGTGVVRGTVLRGNRILNYEDPNQPHRGTLQAIGCFDGFFEDWIIENNEILTDHWHGITLSGARNCRIVNNTVVDLNATSPGPPWIRISQHKDGTASTGNVIRNNLATDYSVDAAAAIQDHNLEIRDYSACFQDYAQRDLRLREGCPAIDAGSAEAAPSTDAAGLPRPLDGDGDGEAGWDMGAHEYVHPTADTDADGMSDVEEGFAGTSPVDSMDVLRLTLTPDSAGTVRLSWPSVAGRGYALLAQAEAAAGAWTSAEGDPGWTGTGEELTTTFPVMPGASYFRLRLAGP